MSNTNTAADYAIQLANADVTSADLTADILREHIAAGGGDASVVDDALVGRVRDLMGNPASETITRDEIVAAMEGAGYGVDIDNAGDVICDVSGGGVDTRYWSLVFYWDSQDLANEGFAWRMTADGDVVGSDSLDTLGEVVDLCERFSARLSAAD